MALGEVIEGSGGKYSAVLVDTKKRSVLQNASWRDVFLLASQRVAENPDGIQKFEVTERHGH